MTKLASVVLQLALFSLTPANAEPGPGKALFGVVPVERGEWVVASEVLPDSPAAEAGLEKGDIIFGLAGIRIEKFGDVDRALKNYAAGDPVEVLFVRGKKKRKAKVNLIAKDEYSGGFPETRSRGETGFEAPDWHIFAWANVSKTRKPPTRANTAGKVVVIHCFQSW